MTPIQQDNAIPSSRKQYKVEVVKEGFLSTLLFQSAKIPVPKMELLLNQYGSAGWTMDFMVIEKRRVFLLWAREAVIITFSHPV